MRSLRKRLHRLLGQAKAYLSSSLSSGPQCGIPSQADSSLIVGNLVPVLLLGIGLALWSWHDYAATESEARRTAVSAAGLYADHVAHALRDIDASLEQTADLISEAGLDGMRSEPMWRRLKSIARALPETGEIFIYGRDGETVATSAAFPPMQFNASGRDYFKVLMQGETDLEIGQALLGRTVHHLFFPVARSVRDRDGRIIAIVQCGVDPSGLGADLSPAYERTPATFGLFRLSDGTLVARVPMTGQDLGVSIAGSPQLAAAKGSAFAWTGWTREPGGERMTAAQRLEGLPLVATASVDATTILSEWRWRTLWRIAGLSLVGLLQILLSRSLALRLERDRERQAKLAGSEQQFRSIVEASPIAILLADSEGRIRAANPKAAALLGYTREELLAASIEMLVPEALRDRHPGWRSSYGRDPARREMGSPGRELSALRKDGNHIPVEIGLAPVDIGGAPCTMATIADVGERKRSEAAAARLAALVTAAPDAAVALDTESNITAWNPAAEQLFGWTAAEAVGQRITIIAPDERRTEQQRVLARVLAGEHIRIDTQRKNKDGIPIDVQIAGAPIVDRSGKVVGQSYLLHDIRERKRAEKELRVRQVLTASQLAEIESVYRTAPVGLALIDRDFRYVRINHLLAAMNGPSVEAHLGRSVREILPGLADTLEPMVRRVLAGETIENLEVEGTTPAAEGAVHQWSVSYYPLRSAEGEIVAVNAVVQDITERRQKEAQLRRSEHRHRAIVEATSAIVWSCPPDGRHVEPQPEWMAFTGQTAAEMLGDGWTKVVHPDDAALAGQRWGEAVATGKPFTNEQRIRRRDGEWRWMSVQAAPLRNDKGEIVEWFGMNRDITDRKEAEASTARLAAIVASSSDAIVSKSLTGIVETWNEGAESIFGYTAGEMIGHSIRELIPEDRQAEEDDLLARIARGEHVAAYETVRLGKGGRRIQTSLSLSPVRDGAGKLIGISKIAQDITERKKREEQVSLLMREVNHRSMNMLALVQAIAQQTAASSPSEFVERFSARLQALSANQDLIVRNEWVGTDLDDLVRAQLAHFDDLVDTRVIIAGPHLRLTTAAAQSLGLALHELATNAAKHGALSNQSGHVDITWRLDRDTFSMTWRESGGPAAAPPTRQGFGSKVIDLMTRRALGANVAIDYPASGLVWRLDCPADKVLDMPQRHESGAVVGGARRDKETEHGLGPVTR